MHAPRSLLSAFFAPLLVAMAFIAIACGSSDDQPNPATASPAVAATATSAARPADDAAAVLLVSDPAAHKVYVYRVPAMELAGTIDARLDAHLGAFTHPDGRVFFSDGEAGEIVAVRFEADGSPVIEARTPATLGDGGVWGGVDDTNTYAVITSGIADTRSQIANIFNLDTYENVAFPVEMQADEELHAYIVRDQLVAGVGGELRSWPLAEALKGAALEPASIVPVGLGSHGQVTSHALGTVYLTTNEGLEGATASGDSLRHSAVIPWNADGLSGGRNARPRLSADGEWIYGAIAGAGPTEPERWAERQQDIHIANITDGSARRIPLAQGVAIRFQLSRTLGMAVTIHPDGDAANFLDVDPASPTFQQLIGAVPLEPLTGGPTAGKPTSGTQSRGVALTPDGAYAFVSWGGEGRIAVIDTGTMRILRTVTAPSALQSGGFMYAVQPDSAWDPAFR